MSDVHANLPALEAVLKDLRRHHPEKVVCAGDLIGYYPWPNEVIDLLRSNNVDCVRGKHDRAAIGHLEIHWFAAHAATALEWTVARLSEESKNYLLSLENHRRFRAGARLVAVYSGSPLDEDEAIFPEAMSGGLLVGAQADVLVLGNTHIPAMGRYGNGVVLNPGSVGQPRDGDPRAAYGTVDTETLTAEVHRVPYDIEAVATRMEEEQLPESLVARLREGR